VTTPHGSKPWASGLTQVCRPIPSFVSCTQARQAQATCVSHGRASVGTFVLLPWGTIYPRTAKHDGVGSRQRELLISSFCEEQKWKC